jgi:hypothetical protein
MGFMNKENEEDIALLVTVKKRELYTAFHSQSVL